MLNYLPEKTEDEPIFDCRVFNVPTDIEAFNSLLWRVIDCRKNSISSLFYYHHGHKKGLGKHSQEKIDILLNKGISWDHQNPKFKYGRFIKKFVVKRKLTVGELRELPPQHNAIKNPDMEFERNVYIEININQPLQEITNPTEFIFNNVEPIFKIK